jgi:hypothetical protein
MHWNTTTRSKVVWNILKEVCYLRIPQALALKNERERMELDGKG